MFVEKVALQQKSKITWFKVGDTNHKYFYLAVKERNGVNTINSLYNNDGILLTNPEDVKKQILGFYKNLLGSGAPDLPGVDLQVVRSGPRLRIEAANSLC